MNIQNIDLFEMHEPLTGSFPFAALTAVLPDETVDFVRVSMGKYQLTLKKFQ